MRTRLNHRLFAAATATIVFAGSCATRLPVQHGLRLSSNGNVVVAASLMSSCECATIHNKSDRKIRLVAFHRQIQRGTPLEIEPGKNRQVAFDWAGSGDLDHYELFVRDVIAPAPGKPDENKEPERPVTDGIAAADRVEIVGEPLQVSCDDSPPGSACSPDGPLQLNAALRRSNSPDGSGHLQGTVAFASDGQALNLSANAANVSSLSEDSSGNLSSDAGKQRNRCSCVVLQAIQPVNLRAMLHGAEIGQVLLPAGQNVPFGLDSAGSRSTDYYTVQALPASGVVYNRYTGVGQTANSPGATSGSSDQKNLRIRDYVSVVGKFDLMNCTATGAETNVFVPERVNDEVKYKPFPLYCPFTLNMNKATPILADAKNGTAAK